MTALPKLFRDAVQYFRRPDTLRENEVSAGKRPGDVPCLRIRAVSLPIMARYTGPDDGLCGLHSNESERNTCENCKENWTLHDKERAYGMALSLYDAARDKRQMHSGDPVADVFGIVSYRNGALLAVADGVNWGEKSRLAARCAIHGSLDYLERNLKQATNTQEVIAHILRSFDAAQKLIIQKQATMTTLCTACICQLEDGRWGLCVVNVGDSLLYVLSPSNGLIREVTGASHPTNRDVREAGGALGPSDGYSPDLGNLTCSFTFVEDGEIVFGVTDGVSDNFDPVIIKRARAVTSAKSTDSILPVMSQADRDEAVQLRMAGALKEELPGGDISSADAERVTSALLRHVVNQTESKRRFLEDANLVQNDPEKERDLISKSRQQPGKLDHATVAAFKVGVYTLPPTKEKLEQCKKLEEELVNL